MLIDTLHVCLQVGNQGIEASWAGGVAGRQVIDRLLPLVPNLLSPRGVFYMVVIKENKPGNGSCRYTRVSKNYGSCRYTRVSKDYGSCRYTHVSNKLWLMSLYSCIKQLWLMSLYSCIKNSFLPTFASHCVPPISESVISYENVPRRKIVLFKELLC